MADVFVKMTEKLENPQPLLKQLGLLGVKESRAAFRKQAFGDIPWSAKYNNAGDPFINVAGAIEDFNAGKNPKPSNLVSRPALIGEGDRGGLRASISYQVLGSEGVEVGSNKPYASLMNRGGNSSVTLSVSGFARLVDWIGKSSIKKSKAKKSKKEIKYYDEDGFEVSKEYGGQLYDSIGFEIGKSGNRKGESRKRGKSGGAYADNVFIKHIVKKGAPYVHSIKVKPRPFVGFTDSLMEEIVYTVERYFGGGAKAEVSA